MIFLRKYGLFFAWLLACIGVLLSLYFSEVRAMQPCNLCWYQRMALFPLSLILGVAAYGGDTKVIRYALPLALVGLCFGLYQIALQEIPDWNPLELCGAGPSCSKKVDIGLGAISLPMLASGAFLVISLLLLGVWHSATREQLSKK